MTETSPVTFSGYSSDPLEVRHSTIGFPADHTEVEMEYKHFELYSHVSFSLLLLEKVKVVNEEGEIVPVNTPGELWTRGYSTMLMYWDDEDKTKETILPDRWLRTG